MLRAGYMKMRLKMKDKPKKNIITRLEEIYLIVLWVILFPFVFLFNLLFGKGKNEVKDER